MTACLEEAVLILEGLCIREELSIRKELTQIIRFLIERMGEGVFKRKIQQRFLIVSYGLVINRSHKPSSPQDLCVHLGDQEEMKLQERWERGLGADPGAACAQKGKGLNVCLSWGRQGRYWGVQGCM